MNPHGKMEQRLVFVLNSVKVRLDFKWKEGD